MKILDVQQGSTEWFAARLGIPTASQFDRILTPKTLKPSTQAPKYMNALLAEWSLGVLGDDGPATGFMERGRDLEAEAASYYAFVHDLTIDVGVTRAGFVLRDDGLVGCSPDRLVGRDGGLEIKVPAAVTHVANLRDMDAAVLDHRLQIQGCLWLCEREWWDFLSYNPDLPSGEKRVYRDEPLLALLIAAMDTFVGELLRARDVMLKLGCTPAVAARRTSP